MPVIDHAVHKKTSIAEDKPYGCFNREIKEAYYAPNRFAGTTGHQPIWWLERIRIPHVTSRECRYDMSLVDKRCVGCKHRESGEVYAKKVKEAAK